MLHIISPNKNLIIKTANKGNVKKVKTIEATQPSIEAVITFKTFIFWRKLKRDKNNIMLFITKLSKIASSI